MTHCAWHCWNWWISKYNVFESWKKKAISEKERIMTTSKVGSALSVNYYPHTNCTNYDAIPGWNNPLLSHVKNRAEFLCFLKKRAKFFSECSGENGRKKRGIKFKMTVYTLETSASKENALHIFTFKYPENFIHETVFNKNMNLIVFHHVFVLKKQIIFSLGWCTCRVQLNTSDTTKTSLKVNEVGTFA